MSQQKESILKKQVLFGLALGLSALVLNGCGKSAVKCDNAEAQKIVMEIAEPEIKNALVRNKNIYASLERWQQAAEEGNAEIENALAEIDIQYQEMAPKLMNIRPESMDNELEKSECAADIGFSNGNRLPITYKLSKTSEGRLYVEVFGL